MGIRLGEGVKVNGKAVQKDVIKKVIVCNSKVCTFGKNKIDDYCAICIHKQDFVLKSAVEPIMIEVSNQFIYKSCFTKKDVPMHKDCPFDFKEVSEKCKGCARVQIQNLSSRTKEIK